MKGTGKVYFIKCENAVKIGYTTDVERRLIQLQTSSPSEMVLLYAFEAEPECEKRLHRKFRKHSIRNEWFCLCDDILSEIERIKVRGHKLEERQPQFIVENGVTLLSSSY